MSITFRAGENAIEKAVRKLKEHEGISYNAVFRHDRIDCLREAVYYKDFDFLHMSQIKSLLDSHKVKDIGSIDKNVVETAMERLKSRGFISSEAYFNYGDLNRLSDEVYYRDFHFLYYLGQYADEEIVDSALDILKKHNIVSQDAGYSKEAYMNLRKEVKERFYYPDTAFFPATERLLYMLSSVKRPEKIIGIGVFCGYTFVWSIGASCSAGKVYTAKKAYGVDIDKASIGIAVDNFKKLTQVEHVELIAEDGYTVTENNTEELDYIYLDADAKDIGKAIYLPLLKNLYRKLKKGGWVLAHDTTLPAFQGQLKQYLDFVRDKRNFSESVAFDIDIFGMELSVK